MGIYLVLLSPKGHDYFGTPFRVRQEGRKGQYRSAKLTGDFCLRSPHKFKFAGPPKESAEDTVAPCCAYADFKGLFLKTGFALHF